MRELGVEDHVVFLNQFVDQATLLEFISMSDVYVTPYLNEAQMTSGTLAYSFGLGKPVVSLRGWSVIDPGGTAPGGIIAAESPRGAVQALLSPIAAAARAGRPRAR